MEQAWFHRLDVWREFYAFTGAAAATLMGLMFVVVSVAQHAFETDEGRRAIGYFFAPIVVFFATEIAVTMLFLVPAITPHWLGVSLGAIGVAGMAYMLSSGVHGRWRGGNLDLDDWTWYFALPVACFAVVTAGGAGVWFESAYGIYGIAVVMGALLLIGVRNAWDLVVFTLQKSAARTNGNDV